MQKEEVATEHVSRASTQSAQAFALPHHRFAHTRLWVLLHEQGDTDGEQACTECRGAVQSEETNPEQATDRLTIHNAGSILEEFLIELRNYCCEEPDLAERMRTLRFTRSGLITALFLRRPPEAGKKCGHLKARRTGVRTVRLRIEHRKNGVGTPGEPHCNLLPCPQKAISVSRTQIPQSGHDGYDRNPYRSSSVGRYRGW